MGEYQHNNPWAEKLLQVSLPDGDQAWQAMKSRLDAQGARWWNRDRRRWLLLILLLLLLIGVCNCPGRSRLFHGNGTVSRQPASGASNPGSPRARRQTPAPLVPAPPASASAVPEPPAPVSVSDRHGPASFEPGSSRFFPGPTPPARRIVPAKAGGNLLAPPLTGPSAPSPTGSATSTGSAAPTKPSTAAPTGSMEPRDPGVHAELVSGAKLLHHTGSARNPHSGRTGRLNQKKIADTLAGDRQDADAAIAGKSMTQGKPTSQAPAPGSHIQLFPATDDSTGTRANRTPPLTKTSSARDSVRKKHPPPPKKEEEEQKEREHGLMAAIGLNQFFPLGGQQAVYSTDGTGGTLRDYIPVPMLRYYFSHKLYVQVEAQFNTPQATKKNLVISSPPPDTSSISGEEIVSSASLRQLFYFNIPLSVHYTLFDNVDIGAGLQFSRLTNAVGSFDTTTTPLAVVNIPSVSTNAVKSFKGEALYRKIKTEEFRFLLDMSYTYKHFIAGMRYNQALSKFVDIQIAPGQSAQGRNSSLQLYLRYILWDGRKNRASPP